MNFISALKQSQPAKDSGLVFSVFVCGFSSAAYLGVTTVRSQDVVPDFPQLVHPLNE